VAVHTRSCQQYACSPSPAVQPPQPLSNRTKHTHIGLPACLPTPCYPLHHPPHREVQTSSGDGRTEVITTFTLQGEGAGASDALNAFLKQAYDDYRTMLRGKPRDTARSVCLWRVRMPRAVDGVAPGMPPNTHVCTAPGCRLGSWWLPQLASH
jgi:hypothetical protein